MQALSAVLFELEQALAWWPLLIVGRIGTSLWSGIVTYRQGRIRIISVRRSRPEEIALYEG